MAGCYRRRRPGGVRQMTYLHLARTEYTWPMPDPLLIIRDGRVEATNDAGQGLLGRCTGLACHLAVQGRAAAAPVCTAMCVYDVRHEDRPRVRIRGSWWRMVCSRVGERVVVQLLPAEPISPAAALTPRERETMRWVAQGLTTSQIAKRMDISRGTVRTHVGRILEKLGATTRAEAVARLRY